MIIKVEFNNEIRRFPINNDAPLVSVKNEIIKRFVLDENASITLKYTDSDNDLISITSDSELSEAFSSVLNGVLRLTFVPTSQSSKLSLESPSFDFEEVTRSMVLDPLMVFENLKESPKIEQPLTPDTLGSRTFENTLNTSNYCEIESVDSSSDSEPEIVTETKYEPEYVLPESITESITEPVTVLSESEPITEPESESITEPVLSHQNLLPEPIPQFCETHQTCPIVWFEVPLSQQESSLENQDQTIHHRGVYCDGCDKTITGIRYKCGHCQDFDFCENCEENNKSHNPNHLFIKVRRPIRIPDQRPLLPTVRFTDSPRYTAINIGTSSYSVSVPPGSIMVASFQLKNNGVDKWPLGVILENQTTKEKIRIPPVFPSQEFTVQINLKAPEQHETTQWILKTPHGNQFGPTLCFNFLKYEPVPSLPTTTNTPSDDLYRDEMIRLVEMGFCDRGQNFRLLNKNGGDLSRVVLDLTYENNYDWHQSR